MLSPKFADKLNMRLNPDPAAIDVGALLELSCSDKAFSSQVELRNHLSEGALVNINTISSQALSVPCGDYMVWTTDSGHTMLVPIDENQPTQDVYEDKAEQYELFTRDLLNNWNTIERVLAEKKSSEDPNFGTNQPQEGGSEKKEQVHGGFRSTLDMATVDRTPIARAMQQRGHTVTSLANAVGVDPPAISRILRTPKDVQGDPGGRNPSLGLAARIAHELKMDAEALFPDIFGTPKQDFQARDTPANRGSGMSGAAKGSTRKGKATAKWTQGAASESRIDERQLMAEAERMTRGEGFEERFQTAKERHKPIRYKGYTISYRAKPIPDSSSDWEYSADDYDGPGDPRAGTAASLDQAKAEIDELIHTDYRLPEGDEEFEFRSPANKRDREYPWNDPDRY